MNAQQESKFCSNVIDMQLYRLRKEIRESRDVFQIAVLAELAMAYVDNEIDITMVNGEMTFKKVDVTPENVVA